MEVLSLGPGDPATKIPRHSQIGDFGQPRTFARYGAIAACRPRKLACSTFTEDRATQGFHENIT